MLINLRNALMAGKRRPYDAEVEFLESTGTQWIDTGIIFGADNGFSITYSPTSADTYVDNSSIFGSRTTNGNTRMMVGFNANSGGTVGIGCEVYVGWGVIAIPATERRVAEKGSWYTATANIFTATATDGLGATASLQTLPTQTRTAYIFGANTQSGPLLCRSRIAACKIYQSGVLVRDYIPVRKGTVGCLYDRVSGELFGNAGTGDFVLGQDVVPVEYIESHGTEWFSAGFNITNAQSFAYDVKFDLAQTITNAQPRLISNEGAGAGNYYDIYYALNALRIRQANAVIGNVLRDVPIVARMTEQGRYYGYYESSPESLLWDVTRAFTAPTVQMNYKIFDRANYNQEQYRWQGKAYYMHFTKDGAPIRKFAPVRVGTGSTWEGAMIDTLTRRIYRNAGTGAFGYGNDLKCPIPAE